MPKDILHYTNNEVTVVWEPKLCTHSTLCWKGLSAVFNPKERPWIKINGDTTEKIIEQVKKCPSGALSYFMNNVQEEDPAPSPDALKVQVTPGGPYLINTNCIVVHANGEEEIKNGTIALCRCGASANKPYCDGSHRKINFSG